LRITASASRCIASQVNALILILPAVQIIMLKELHIRNYAIIDSLDTSFSKGLTIITGETGAGKSILMGALSLILGERVDSTMVLDKEKKCVVEGVFDIAGKNKLWQWLEATELDADNELVIRREFGSNGKSRAFINDTPVSLQQLQELTSQLVDLHRQFDTQYLGSSGFQLNVVDAMAGNEKRREAYSKLYIEWQQQKQLLQQLQDEQARNKKELDYNQFLFDELEAAQLQENSLETADEELQLLNNAEGIKQALAFIDHTVRQQDEPILQLLKQMQQQLQAYAAKHTGMEELRSRLQSVQVELNDIAAEADQLSGKIGYDPERINRLQDQLNAGYKLLKKHAVKTTAELIAIRQNLSDKLLAVQQGDDQLQSLQTSVTRLRELLEKAGATLSTARQSQTAPVEKAVNKLLTRIGMPNARLKIDIHPTAPGPDGIDQVDFLFDANKSGQFAPLRKVASGGELSRLMLSIKSLVAGRIDLPTLIFDEIDTGISGEASLQVGQIMKELAQNRQVICITHQPQIAGKADLHLFVYKEPNGKQVQTRIRSLEKEARIRAIAEMLAGASPSAAALENAREMVQSP